MKKGVRCFKGKTRRLFGNVNSEAPGKQKERPECPINHIRHPKKKSLGLNLSTAWQPQLWSFCRADSTVIIVTGEEPSGKCPLCGCTVGALKMLLLIRTVSFPGSSQVSL